MSKLINILFASCLFVLFLSMAAAAQSSTATLSGTVEDENGAIIPGAKVTITRPETGLESTVVTNNSGSFTIPLLPPGEYTVHVEREGFTRVQLTNIVLNVGDQKSVAVQLKVGDVASTVEVRPDANLIDTDPSVGTVIDRTFVQNIPLNGRSFQSLLELTPGVVLTFGGSGFSVNGQRTTSNVFTVDGVNANTAIASTSAAFVGQGGSGQLPGYTAQGTTAGLVSVDALQEFRIQTSSYAPEFGRQPGGQVQLVTRSGTNDFHGALYDYARNEAFDANNWFNNRNGQPKPPTRQQQFGGTLSGPVYFPNFGDGGKKWYSGKNRTFFFFSYEALRLQLPKSAEVNVPTLCFRGDAPCPAGREPALERFWPFLKAVPRPNGAEVFASCTPGPNEPLCDPATRTMPSGFAKFTASYSDPSEYDSMAIRVDHSFGKKVTVFGRFSRTPSAATTRSTTTALSTQRSSSQNATSFTAGSIWSISNTFVNDLRVNYTTNDGPFFEEPDDFGGSVPLTTLGFLGGDPARRRFGLGLFGVGNIGPTISWGGYNGFKQRQFNVVDNLIVTAGDHLFKFGVDFRRTNPLLQRGGSAAGLESMLFRYSNLVAGRPESGRVNVWSVTLSDGLAHAAAFNNVSLYAQDTWRVGSRLTLTYGIRWEFVPPPHATEGPEATVFNGLEDPLGPNGVSVAPSDVTLWTTRYYNFAPRLGASYMLVEKPGRQLVVRGGVGIFYDLGLGDSVEGYRGFAWPFSGRLDYPLAGHTDPACRPGNLPFPLPPCALVQPVPGNVPPSTINTLDRNVILPRTYQFNFSAEQSIGSHQSLTVSFVGAEGRELLKNERFSQIRIRGITYPGAANSLLFVQRNGGYSDYRSLQVQFQRRLSRGLQAVASYTLARSRDTDSGDNLEAAPGDIVTPDQRYGYSNFDVRNNFTAAATYQVPSLKGSSFLKIATNDWAIDLIFRARSGFPLNATTNVPIPPLAGNTPVQADVVPGQPFWVDDPSAPGGRRLNRLAFSVPTPAGTIGDLPRNAIRGFGAKQLDIGVRREFHLTEQVRLQFRLEAFNLFNWPNFGDPSGSFTAATLPQNFGAATQTLNNSLGGLAALYQIGGPRSMQGMVRISF